MKETHDPSHAPPEGERSIHWWLTTLIALFAVGILIRHAASYLPYIMDDALISLRYARRLIEGHGLTWSGTEHVEGYSNLLWILACAALGRFGVDLIDSTRILGILSSIAAIAAVIHAYPPRRTDRGLPAFVGTLALALSGSIAIWSIGGLEQAFLSGLLAWAMVWCYPLLNEGEGFSLRTVVRPAIPLALICLTRPDGALFTAAACFGLLAARGFRAGVIKAAVLLAVIPFLAYAGQLMFRLIYYGGWVPNSALAKVSFSTRRVSEGLGYVAGGVWLLGLLVPSFWVYRAGSGETIVLRRARFLTVPFVLWTVYVIFIGGDNFVGRRHLTPLVVLLALMAAETFRALLLKKSEREAMRQGASDAPVMTRDIGMKNSEDGKVLDDKDAEIERLQDEVVMVRNRLRRYQLWSAAVFLIALHGFLQHYDPENQRTHKQMWAWTGKEVGIFLSNAFGEKAPLVAVDAGGSVPYFSGLPSLDMLGLNDKWLAQNRPPTFGQGWLAHELGDGGYVLGRKPDLVLFCSPRGKEKPCFRGGEEMQRDRRFRDLYRMVHFESPEPDSFSSIIWLRVEDGKLGIRREDGRLWIPGYVLVEHKKSRVLIEDMKHTGVMVTRDAPATKHRIHLDVGDWRLRVNYKGAPIETQILSGRHNQVLATGSDEVSFTMFRGGDEEVDIEISSPTGRTAIVRDVVLERVERGALFD
jgi:hypothetical protein